MKVVHWPNVQKNMFRRVDLGVATLRGVSGLPKISMKDSLCGLFEAIISCLGLCGNISPPANNADNPVIVQQPSAQANHPYVQGQAQPASDSKQDSEKQAESLRAKAKQLALQKTQFFEKSQIAWNKGDKQLAKEHSNKAKDLTAKMNDLNAQASQLFLQSKNKGRELNEIDLHGQFVKEALSITEARIHECRAKGYKELIIIVGKGLHSIDGIAKIKPAIIELLQKENLSTKVGQPNPGCVTVLLERSRSISTDYDSQVNQCPIQ